MTCEEIKTRLQALGAETEIEVVDLTGTGDHYQATVVSPAFENKSLMAQHKMVFELLAEEMKSGEIHALSLKTKMKSLKEAI